MTSILYSPMKFGSAARIARTAAMPSHFIALVIRVSLHPDFAEQAGRFEDQDQRHEEHADHRS